LWPGDFGRPPFGTSNPLHPRGPYVLLQSIATTLLCKTVGLEGEGVQVHIPDGFINAGTSVAAGGVAAGGLAVAIKRSAAVMEDKLVPLAGLVAAFIFAVQMLNFPVAGGTSGHLLGGALAAILVGPWAGAICVAVVLMVQALFADGGLTALGLNILNMALVTSLGGYAVFLGLKKILPATRRSVVAASGLSAALSVVAASVAFTIEYAIGGNSGASVAAVGAAMIGVHTLIGIGEGLITGVTVGAVLNVRPDLVYGAADLPLTSEPYAARSPLRGSA
jgi:cobalt/nickel transport system permease protein